MSHYTLSAAEAERYAMLAEEAGEIVQECMKILRHGAHSYHPADVDRLTNKARLSREVGNMQYMIERMRVENDLNDFNIYEGVASKQRNWPLYTHHQHDSKEMQR